MATSLFIGLQQLQSALFIWLTGSVLFFFILKKANNKQ